MPNLLAQIVLYSWPLVAWMLFSRLRVSLALPATVILGYLFIPERTGFDLPILPPLDKTLMPSLSAAIMILLKNRSDAIRAGMEARRAAVASGEPAKGRGGLRATRNRDASAQTRVASIVPAIMAILLITPILTWATNQSPQFFGPKVLPGMRPYDIGSVVLDILVTLLPFWLARKHLATREAQLDILKVLVYSAFAYSFLVLWEARMSPQINRTLYGFFPHSWVQHIRGGAFRPIVFLSHGLRVGIFLAMAVLGAAVLARSNVDGKRGRWLGLTFWLLLCLVMSRNLGATMIVVCLLPAVLMAPVRIQFLIAAIVAVVVTLYPLARGSGLIPAERIAVAIQSIDADRAGSLEYRLRNEDLLLAKANQKPLAGWGGWGRSLIFDPNSGSNMTIADGTWVIIIGVYGWLGYLGQFGLLCLPIVIAAARWKSYNMDALDAGMAIVLAANLIDLIPNSSNVAVLWLIAGAAWARLELSSTTPARNRQGKGPGRGGTQRSASTVPERSQAPERTSSSPTRSPARPGRGPIRQG